MKFDCLFVTLRSIHRWGPSKTTSALETYSIFPANTHLKQTRSCKGGELLRVKACKETQCLCADIAKILLQLLDLKEMAKQSPFMRSPITPKLLPIGNEMPRSFCKEHTQFPAHANSRRLKCPRHYANNIETSDLRTKPHLSPCIPKISKKPTQTLD